MKPLRLEIEGLRSYRHRQEIDFRGKNLVAIVGNTGAGKSSILEAMVYALYNASTWDERSVQALIADGQAKMEVVLDFEVAGRAWRVERASCRDNYPPSRHKLTCLSDANEPALTQESAIKKAIETLLGLKYEAFKSAILLPQGQFQALLAATDTIRTGILKAVLRLDLQIDAVREGASEASSRLVPRLDVMTAKRRELYPDPAATAREARQRREEAAGRLAVLKAVAARHAEVTGAAEQAAGESATLTQRQKRLTEVLTGEGAALAELVPVFARLTERRRALQAELETATEDETVLGTSLKEAESRGKGLADLKAAEATLRGMYAALPELAAEEQRLAAEERALGEEARSLATAAIRSRALADEVRACEDRLRKAVEATAAALTRHNDAKAGMAAARRAEKEATAAGEAAGTARQRLVACQAEARQEAELQRRAAADLNKAEAAYETAQRTHAAAHAAKGLAAGDACPICTQPLPRSFVAPHSDGGQAETAYREAQSAATGALGAAGAANAKADAAQETCAEKERAAGTRLHEAAEGLAALKKLAPSADLADSDAANLAPLLETLQNERAAEAEVQKARDQARADADAYEGGLTPRRTALDERQKKKEAARKVLASRTGSLEQQRIGLPESLRPGDGATAADVETILRKIVQELRAIHNLAERHAAAARKREELRAVMTKLSEQEAETVTRREQKAWPQLLILADRARECGRDVGRLPPPIPATNAPLVERADWAVKLEESVREQIADLQRRSAAAADQAMTAAAERERILANGGYRSREDLADTVASTSGALQAATTEEQKALGQVPLARELDARIRPAEGLRDALMELTRLLSDGKFVKFVVARRQRTLLAVASTILQSMTRNRYAFAENFKVVDLLTSQARPVETLSGGETFLASLALALGLVELAGRGGGRVDSLILDEGFATLDGAALTCALDELVRRAGSGKLVALVSHLGAVADVAPEVLYVLQRDGSSVIRWRSETEDDPELDAIDAQLHRAS